MIIKEKLISRDIPLSPSYMNKNLINIIHARIFAFIGLCDENDGYITKIHRDTIKIIEGIIQPSCGHTIFKTTFKVTFSKPEVGDAFKCKITHIIEDGLWVKSRMFDILISPSIQLDMKITTGPAIKSMVNGKEIFKKGKIIMTVNGITVSKGDSLTVMIKNIRYGKGNFDVLGKIKDGSISSTKIEVGKIEDIISEECDKDKIKNKNTDDIIKSNVNSKIITAIDILDDDECDALFFI